MRKPLSILAALCLASLTTGAALAQTTTTLSCSDFVRNPDGSWSSVKPVSFGGITLGPGVKFSPGVRFNGVDLGSTLNMHCRSSI